MTAEFYSTLLGIEVTILGIIAAATFVLLQMLHSNFSYKDMLISLKRPSLSAFFILSVLLVIFTGLGLLHNTLAIHDFVLRINLNSGLIFNNSYVLLGVLVSFLLSISLGVFSIFESIRLLNPSTLIRKHIDLMSAENIEKFLYRKYGVQEPFRPISFSISFSGQENTPEEVAKKESEDKKKEEEYIAQVKHTEILKKQVANSEDVFEGFENLLIKSIAQADQGTFKYALVDYEVKIVSIIGSVSKTFPLKEFAVYIGESLNIYLEATRKHNVVSFAPRLIECTRKICIELSKNGNEVEVCEIFKVFKKQADVEIGNLDQQLFREIVKSYEEIGDAAFGAEDQNNNRRERILDDVFRHLGWLSERLLTKNGINERPVMYDDNYEDEFSILYNALFHFDHIYNYKYIDAYPIIFFDAIQVLYDEMLKIYAKLDDNEDSFSNKRAHIKDWLFSCAYVFSSFSSNAIRVSNGDGVSLAGLKLKQVYKSAVKVKADDLAKDIVELLVRLYIQCGTNPEKIVGDRYGTKTVLEDTEEVILGSAYRQNITSAVFENYLKIDESGSKNKYEYIKSLGKKMNSNFGLRFDPSTGNEYPVEQV